MIKNTIIVILLLLLIITIYSYVCLSTNIVNYEKERMEFILTKESEVAAKQNILVETVKCNSDLTNYKSSIRKLTTDLNKLSNDLNDLAKSTITLI
jgi:uncharacterized protein (UPF0333 family)